MFTGLQNKGHWQIQAGLGWAQLVFAPEFSWGTILKCESSVFLCSVGSLGHIFIMAMAGNERVIVNIECFLRPMQGIGTILTFAHISEVKVSWINTKSNTNSKESVLYVYGKRWAFWVAGDKVELIWSSQTPNMTMRTITKTCYHCYCYCYYDYCPTAMWMARSTYIIVMRDE